MKPIRAITALLLLASPPLMAQQLTGYARQRALDMLGVVRADIARNYFDTLYHGLNLSAVFDSAESRIRSAVSLEQILGVIGQATATLEDSHTLFLPPGLVYRAEYGWELGFVGDTCRVRKVTPGSDAEAQGLKVGDAVLAVQGLPVSRTNLWQLEYLLQALRPASAVRMVARSPGGTPRQLDLAARVVQRHAIIDPGSSADIWEFLRDDARDREAGEVRWFDIEHRVIVFRLPRFSLDGAWVDRLAREIKGHEAVVLDLRGNHGGSVDQLLRLLGVFYESDFSMARMVERRKQTDLMARGRGANRFAGKVLVLQDAASASASELFARSLQLTGRGTVLGDRSAGAVRVSHLYIHASGTQTAAFYGTSVTVGDVIMPDGGVLEGAGVVPDEMVLPTGEQLNRKADPVLARALALAGVTWTPEQAGLHPW